jgi:conserved hypothetical protein TIGR00266
MAKFEILGNDLQYIKVELLENEKVYGDAGHLLMKSKTVTLQARAKGGFLSAIKRELTGASFFVNELIGPGIAIFAGIFPGKIVNINLNNNVILAESHSFLLAEDTVQYDAQLAKLSVGILGGEGIFLAKLYGIGNLFLHSYGALYHTYLNHGEKIQVEATHLLAFDGNMNYSISRVGNITTMLFGGEGLFFVELEGPGNVWLHSITAQQLAYAIRPYLPSGQQGGFTVRI